MHLKVINFESKSKGEKERDRGRRQVRVYVNVCEFEGSGGFRRVSLPGFLLGFHSLKLFFYKEPCLAERGQPARIKRKGWANPVKDATVAM